MLKTRSLRACLNFALASTTSLSLLALSLQLAVAESPQARRPVLQPDFGPNVLLFDPSMPSADIQTQIDKVYAIQQHSEFGAARYALLFLPGEYHVDVPVGFYTQVLGLGATSDAVHITGNVHSDASLPHNNATCTFWRGVEGFSVTPNDGTMQWAVSQAVPFRRMHILGNIVLHQKGGWASGGWMSDSLIDGNVGCRSAAAMDLAQQRVGQLDRRQLEYGFRWHPASARRRVAAASLHQGRTHARRPRKALSRSRCERELERPRSCASDQ